MIEETVETEILLQECNCRGWIMRNFFYYHESEDNRKPSYVGWTLELVDTSKLQPLSNEIDDEVNDDD